MEGFLCRFLCIYIYMFIVFGVFLLASLTMLILLSPPPLPPPSPLPPPPLEVRNLPPWMTTTTQE